MIYQGGPDGRREIARSRGRDEIIAGIVAGWERTAATWYPGALIHQIGSVLAEPAADGRIRCRCYASILALDPAGAAVLRGYLSYDDIWALDAGEWRLAYRETVMYGYPLSHLHAAPWVGGRGEDDWPVVGDGDGVLDVSGAAAVGAADGPAGRGADRGTCRCRPRGTRARWR